MARTMRAPAGASDGQLSVDESEQLALFFV
jgi:hypothetical protein